MDLYTYKRLAWDIQTFRDNTQKIAETLADSTADLGSRQNLTNDQYADIYDLTSITDELAKSIVDSLTELSALEEDPNPSFTTRLMRKMVPQNEKELEGQFKPAFEHFQKLHRQVMEKQRVAIVDLRKSIALSGISGPDDQSDSYTVHITPAVVDDVFRPASEIDIDAPSLGEQTQLLKSTAGSQFLLELMREKQRDLQRLETQAVELHSIQTKLAGLVQKHGETIDSVDVHVEETHEYTDKANTELVSAGEKKRSASRKRCICVLVIIIIVLVILGTIALIIYDKFFSN